MQFARNKAVLIHGDGKDFQSKVAGHGFDWGISQFLGEENIPRAQEREQGGEDSLLRAIGRKSRYRR